MQLLDKCNWSGTVALLSSAQLPVFINALKTCRVFPVCSLELLMPIPSPQLLFQWELGSCCDGVKFTRSILKLPFIDPEKEPGFEELAPLDACCLENQ